MAFANLLIGAVLKVHAFSLLKHFQSIHNAQPLWKEQVLEILVFSLSAPSSQKS